MPGLIETSSIPVTPIYIIQAHTVTSCQTQQAMHNVMCDVLWQKKNSKKIINIFVLNIEKKIKIKKKIPKQNVNIFPPHKICIVSHSSYHTHRITLIVSHSYHTRRITLPSYFRWNMTNIGAINITLVYDNIFSVMIACKQI